MSSYSAEISIYSAEMNTIEGIWRLRESLILVMNPYISDDNEIIATINSIRGNIILYDGYKKILPCIPNNLLLLMSKQTQSGEFISSQDFGYKVRIILCEQFHGDLILLKPRR
jgi:hypothetical protein